MSANATIVILIYYIISIFYMLYLFGKYKVCPELLWCASQFFMFFGITHFIDSNYKSDELLLWMYLLALVCFIIASNTAQLIYAPKRTIPVERKPEFFQCRKIYIWIMMLVSIALCGMFFARGGGNVFLNGIWSLISGNEYSTKYSRMGLLSVSGVGYIYQLRVVIFPLLVLYYIIIKKRRASSVILAILMLSFLVGTGQRGGLFSFIAIVVITLYYLYGDKEEQETTQKKPRTIMIYIGVLGISGLLFGLSTVLNGRVAEGGSVFSAILQRFIEDNQSSAVWGFRYINNEPIQYGKDWLMQLVDILPGQNNYMSLDTRIFAYMHGGSTAGTAPPCIWGSAYYNFGVLGVVLLSTILGFVMTRLHAKFSKKKNDECSVIIYSAEQFLLAYWVAAGPIVLFNNGFVSVLLLNMIMFFALRYPLVIGR